MVARGDSRISIQLARNPYTVKLGRENRFLVDDPDSPQKLAYILSKPLKRGLSYNTEGTYKFVLQEVSSTKYDNHDLGIADYYKFYPREGESDLDPMTDPGNAEVDTDENDPSEPSAAKEKWL